MHLIDHTHRVPHPPAHIHALYQPHTYSATPTCTHICTSFTNHNTVLHPPAHIHAPQQPHTYSATPTCTHTCTSSTTHRVSHPPADIHALYQPHTHSATPTCTHTCTSSTTHTVLHHLHTYMCHGTLMSVHWASQITSDKLAILDCNRFIKSTTNWYPKASKEPFYCIV